MTTTPQDLTAAVYLSANRIAPSHDGVDLGIGDAALIKALAEAYGRKEGHIKNQLTESGKDSRDKKRNHIKGLLVAAIDCEPLYLIRLLQSKMRIGLAEQTVLIALGQASAYSEKHSNTPPIEEAAKITKQVYSVLRIYDKIVAALLHDGVWKLQETCTFTLGVPVGFMLAKPTRGVSEILDKFQDTEFTCEYKYDGERARIHYMKDGSVEIYSRKAERNTGKYPDVVNSVSRFGR